MGHRRTFLFALYSKLVMPVSSCRVRSRRSFSSSLSVSSSPTPAGGSAKTDISSESGSGEISPSLMIVRFQSFWVRPEEEAPSPEPPRYTRDSLSGANPIFVGAPARLRKARPGYFAMSSKVIGAVPPGATAASPEGRNLVWDPLRAVVTATSSVVVVDADDMLEQEDDPAPPRGESSDDDGCGTENDVPNDRKASRAQHDVSWIRAIDRKDSRFCCRCRRSCGVPCSLENTILGLGIAAGIGNRSGNTTDF
mmetsp:Transcript_19867/g.46547  ORF Transcript_19867/g.46547 Transcript_19867/m.46547 type:complete len:252 (+) Transcript_19867:5316-6071(+)